MNAMTFIVKKIDRPSRMSIVLGTPLAFFLGDRRCHPAAQAAVQRRCLDSFAPGAALPPRARGRGSLQ